MIAADGQKRGAVTVELRHQPVANAAWTLRLSLYFSCNSTNNVPVQLQF